jgi:hypothetical protein
MHHPVSTLHELPLFDSHRAIHSEKAYCDPARRSQAEDLPIAKLVVLIPAIQAGVEQARDLSGFGIYRGDVTTFEPVADRAAQSQILHYGLPPVLHCDYVIDFVLRQRESF